MSWKTALEPGTTVVLSTTNNDGSPHANIVASKGFVDDKLLINNCAMATTLKNIKNNNAVCVVVQKNNEYYRIKGKATVYESGTYFEIAKERNQPPPVKSAIVVEITEVFDLDKSEKVLI